MELNQNKLFRITAPHFVAGGELCSKMFVVKAAPIIKYMLGYTISRVEWYCEKKGWSLEVEEN